MSDCDGIDAHHVTPAGYGLMGSKVSDFLAVPLCRLHHQMAHDYPSSHRPYLQAAVRKLNAEYFKKHKPQKQRRKPMKTNLDVKNCEKCGHMHEIPWSKVTRSQSKAEFICINTNERVSI